MGVLRSRTTENQDRRTLFAAILKIVHCLWRKSLGSVPNGKLAILLQMRLPRWVEAHTTVLNAHFWIILKESWSIEQSSASTSSQTMLVGEYQVFPGKSYLLSLAGASRFTLPVNPRLISLDLAVNILVQTSWWWQAGNPYRIWGDDALTGYTPMRALQKSSVADIICPLSPPAGWSSLTAVGWGAGLSSLRSSSKSWKLYPLLVPIEYPVPVPQQEVCSSESIPTCYRGTFAPRVLGYRAMSGASKVTVPSRPTTGRYQFVTTFPSGRLQGSLWWICAWSSPSNAFGRSNKYHQVPRTSVKPCIRRRIHQPTIKRGHWIVGNKGQLNTIITISNSHSAHLSSQSLRRSSSTRHLVPT